MPEESENRIVPAVPDAESAVKPPPHPFDSKWFLHQNDQVYGPYTGHDLKKFAADGIIDASVSVAREGSQTWTKAADDPVLLKLFQASRPPAPPPNISAAQGATVVQITNQIGPNPAFVDDGEFGPKSAGVALLLSILFVGAGQLYNGQITKGILMFFGCVLLWFVLLGWIINIWSWIDAYQTAKKINARYLRRLAAGQPV